MEKSDEFILLKTLQSIIQEPIQTNPEFIIPNTSSSKSSWIYKVFCFLISLPVYLFLMLMAKVCIMAKIL